MEAKRLSFKHKNNKGLYYLSNYLKRLVPAWVYRSQLKGLLNSADQEPHLEERLNYYNKLNKPFELSDKAKKIKDIRLSSSPKTYFFDFRDISKYFNRSLKGHFLFGDIIDIPSEPSFVKSRPISANNENAVLLKWNKVRHFTFVNDIIPFAEKKDLLVGRNKVHRNQKERILFLEEHFKNPLCDVGKVNDNELDSTWNVNRMTISEQLEYKFILCLEGNDVASNLKWVMSSNSIAVMCQPKYETWFMEGRLIPNQHYIQVKDDFSDLNEQLNHYINHPQDASEILKHAHDYVDQFKDSQTEKILSVKVMDKYFSLCR